MFTPLFRSLLPFTCCLLLSTVGLSQSALDSFFVAAELRHDTITDHTGLVTDWLTFTEESDNLIIYCTGSLPVPLYLEDNGQRFFTVPFSLDSLRPDYTIAMAAKPGVPLSVPKSGLNDRYQAVTATGKFPAAYLDRNYLDYYVEATIGYLERRLAGNKYRRVVVAGHSQGARVAAKVAATHPAVTHLVYLSGNPLGRYDQLIREQREAALVGATTEEEAEQTIRGLYERWRQINAAPNSLDDSQGDSNKTWVSFSEATTDELVGADMPVFVGYGTRDIVARYCDLLPLHFISAGKDHLLTLKTYPGRDHSFFPVAPDGRVDYSQPGFQDVISDVLRWVGEN